MFNNFREVGPLLLKKIFSISVEDNKYTWARDSNLLFVDQPIGTGVSCLAPNTAIPTNSSGMNLIII
jgi:carboxypeptidase C (cathepsin A)